MADPLARLSDLVARWDALQHRWDYRAGGVLLGLALCGAIVASPPPQELAPAGWRTLGVAALMALWWLGGVLPVTVTALVPLVAFPLLGVATIGQTAAPYAHPLVFLMLGGFLLGHGMEVVGLHERLVALLLRIEALGRDPRRVVLGLMIACAAMSGLVSNTATTVMLLPIALLLADRCGADARGRSAFALALAYAASIGGVSTLIGTFPNAVLAQVASTQGREIDFARWMLVGVPFTVVALPLAWWVVTRMLIPAGGRAPEAPPIPAWRPGERGVLAVVALAMAAWLTRRQWSEAAGLAAHVDDAWVAMVAGVSLFLLPAGGRPLVDFREVERRVPWSVLFLLGGGFALADTIRDSGLTAWLAGFTQHLAALPAPVAVLGLCLVVTFLTELTSNTATTQILLPLLAAGAAKAGVDPLVWMVPATISASCAFMLPVATPPNAIAAQGADVRPGDMAAAGLALNLALALWVAVIGLVLAPWVL